MRKEKTLFLVGIWIAVLPFLGFPGNWRKTFFLITGFAIMYLSYLFYIEIKARLSKDATQSKTFIDNIEN